VVVKYIDRFYFKFRIKNEIRMYRRGGYIFVSVVYCSEFLATDPEVPGTIPGASRFSEKQRLWNGVHSAS
jgi:hypothetical protein